MEYGHEIPSQLRLEAKGGMLHIHGKLWGIRHVVNKQTSYTNEVNGDTALYCHPPASGMDSFKQLLHTPAYYVYEVHEVNNPRSVKQYLGGKVTMDVLHHDTLNDKKRSRCTLERMNGEESKRVFEEMKRQKCSDPSRFCEANRKSQCTTYNARTYMSRLEAMHALQMDLMGVEHDYEGCQWDLGDGTYYSPDFYLKNHGPRGTYLEIKPRRPADDAMLKCIGLCSKTGQCVVLFFGTGFGPAFVANDKDRTYKHAENYIGMRFSYNLQTKKVDVDHDVTWVYDGIPDKFIIDKRVSYEDNRHLHPKVTDLWTELSEASRTLLKPHT